MFDLVRPIWFSSWFEIQAYFTGVVRFNDNWLTLMPDVYAMTLVKDVTFASQECEKTSGFVAYSDRLKPVVVLKNYRVAAIEPHKTTSDQVVAIDAGRCC